MNALCNDCEFKEIRHLYCIL